MIGRGSNKDSEFLKKLFEPYGCKIIKTFTPVDIENQKEQEKDRKEERNDCNRKT